MKSTQQKVVDYLRTHPYSTGAEIAAGLVGLGKSQSAIDSSIKALRLKGFCRKTGLSGNAWRYELTEKIRANHYSSVLSLSVTLSAPKEVLPEEGRIPFSYAKYKPPPWESARPGADDHSKYKTRGF